MLLRSWMGYWRWFCSNVNYFLSDAQWNVGKTTQ